MPHGESRPVSCHRQWRLGTCPAPLVGTCGRMRGSVFPAWLVLLLPLVLVLATLREKAASPAEFAAAFVMAACLIFELRLWDDLSDLELDRQLHPERRLVPVGVLAAVSWSATHSHDDQLHSRWAAARVVGSGLAPDAAFSAGGLVWLQRQGLFGAVDELPRRAAQVSADRRDSWRGDGR